MHHCSRDLRIRLPLQSNLPTICSSRIAILGTSYMSSVQAALWPLCGVRSRWRRIFSDSCCSKRCRVWCPYEWCAASAASSGTIAAPLRPPRSRKVPACRTPSWTRWRRWRPPNRSRRPSSCSARPRRSSRSWRPNTPLGCSRRPMRNCPRCICWTLSRSRICGSSLWKPKRISPHICRGWIAWSCFPQHWESKCESWSLHKKHPKVGISCWKSTAVIPFAADQILTAPRIQQSPLHIQWENFSKIHIASHY